MPPATAHALAQTDRHQRRQHDEIHDRAGAADDGELQQVGPVGILEDQ